MTAIPPVTTRMDAPSRSDKDFDDAVPLALSALDTICDEINATVDGMNAFGVQLGSLSNIILEGSGPPDVDEGQDGNFYWDTAPATFGDIYYRSAGVWTKKGRVAGATSIISAADTGTADAYVMTPNPALTALDPSRLYMFRAANANTEASTLNVSALGAKALVDRAGAALSAGTIAAGQLVLVGYVSALDSFMLVGGGGSSGAASTAAWTAFEALPTRTDDATFTVADTAANQGIFVPGRPIRFRANSSASWAYAMVTAYASGEVTIAGAPYTETVAADSGREMQYGDTARLVQETFALAGRFASVATTQALRDMLLLDYVWTRGAAHCVGFRARPLVDDSGASQPHVNVSCAGNLVGTANSNAGLAVSDAAWTATTTDIDPANAAIAFGQALEVAIDAAGTNDDARDLTLIVNFVLE